MLYNVMSQSHSPYLYNDQLQIPGITAKQWNDLLDMITVDIFEQLDLFHKLINQRYGSIKNYELECRLERLVSVYSIAVIR